MAVSLLISSGSRLYEVAQSCNKIDRIKLRAGFPFGNFEIPTFKYDVLKSRLDSLPLIDRTNFITTVSGRGFGKAEFTSEVENLNVKGEDFYTIQCTQKITNIDLDQQWTRPEKSTSYINIYDLLFTNGFIIPEAQFIEFYTPTYDIWGIQGDTRSRNNVAFGNLYLKREGSYVINYDMIKTALSVIRWFISNSSPRIANYNANEVILNQINLIDPYLWDLGNPFVLDDTLIIKESEVTSLAGFSINRDIIDYETVDLRPFNEVKNALGFPDYYKNIKEVREYDPAGTGKKHTINMTSPVDDIYIKQPDNKYYNLFSEYGAFLEGTRIATYYIVHIRNKKLTIETLQNTNIVPYRSVTLRYRKYYCVEAQLDIKNNGINKYILQMRYI